GLALLVGRHDHRPADREDPVEAARDDEAGQPASEADDVDMRGGERLRKELPRLVGEKAHLWHLEPACERDELLVARAGPDDRDRQPVDVAKKSSGANETPEVLRVADVSGVHDDEPAVEP